jgi:hypothetical protein
LGRQLRSKQSLTIAELDGHDLIRADVKISNLKETSLFSSLLSPALVSLLSTGGFTLGADCKVSVPLPRYPSISPLSFLLLSVFGECHGHFSPLSLPRCTSILLLNLYCLVFFYLCTTESSSEEVVCLRIYF